MKWLKLNNTCCCCCWTCNFIMLLFFCLQIQCLAHTNFPRKFTRQHIYDNMNIYLWVHMNFVWFIIYVSMDLSYCKTLLNPNLAKTEVIYSNSLLSKLNFLDNTVLQSLWKCLYAQARSWTYMYNLNVGYYLLLLSAEVAYDHQV